MVLAWSVAPEDSGIEPESLPLNKRQVETWAASLQGIGSTEKRRGIMCSGPGKFIASTECTIMYPKSKVTCKLHHTSYIFLVQSK